MCNEIWKEFRGWCKSFTRTETLLAILEAVLLVICVGFLIFLILHLIACEKRRKEDFTDDFRHNVTKSTAMTATYTATAMATRSSPQKFTKPDLSTTSTTLTTSTRWTTLPPHVKCTWEPSQKTAAVTHYYVDEAGNHRTEPGTAKPIPESTVRGAQSGAPDLADDSVSGAQGDGEEAEGKYKAVILALVKMIPPDRVTFGCTLTAISDRWTLTAASCIESAEEVDSLDSFVMMEEYGGGATGRSHAVADVRLHPRFQGAHRGSDLAALRSEGRLAGATPAHLPRPVDRWLLALGERFTILGFGSYRTIEKSTYGRSVRSVRVHSVSARQCGPASREGWSARHLAAGRARPPWPPSAGGPLCAGPLLRRASPCTFCAGTPLLRGATLLAVMAAADRCAVACEPALYADVAAARPWIDEFIDS